MKIWSKANRYLIPTALFFTIISGETTWITFWMIGAYIAADISGFLCRPTSCWAKASEVDMRSKEGGRDGKNAKG